jgi:hypothetical protein
MQLIGYIRRIYGMAVSMQIACNERGHQETGLATVSIKI